LTGKYLAGLDILEALGNEKSDSLTRAAEVAPEFVRLAIGFTFGDLWDRPGLDLKTRALIEIAFVIASRASAEALRTYVQSALRLGWTREEVIEAIVQSAARIGIPTALSALTECHDMLVIKDPSAQCCEDGISDTGQA